MWIRKAALSAFYKYSAIQDGHQEVAQKLPELLTGNMIWMYALLYFLALADNLWVANKGFLV